jgi:hypothetical protein
MSYPNPSVNWRGSEVPDEFSLGPFTFEYDAKLSEMYVTKGEETAGMIECVTKEQWREFFENAMTDPAARA